MTYQDVYYDYTLGKIILGPISSGSDLTNNTYLQLFTGLDSNSCIMNIGGMATNVNALYNNPSPARDKPYVDGVVLQKGDAGSNVLIAMQKGMQYFLANPLPNFGQNIWLGNDGKLTIIEPTLLNGALWKVKVGRYVTNNLFIFDPEDPIDLNAPIGGGGGPAVPDTATCGESLAAFACFKYKDNGIIYKATSLDSTLPIIDGITLESGTINQSINIGITKNKQYTTNISYTSNSLLYLSKTGTLTLTPPTSASGDLWSYIIGRTIKGTNNFVFDPQMPIRLI